MAEPGTAYTCEEAGVDYGPRVKNLDSEVGSAVRTSFIDGVATPLYLKTACLLTFSYNLCAHQEEVREFEM